MSDMFFDFYTPLLEEQKLSETEFAALDFETTGLYPEEDRVVEVGIMKFNLKGELENLESLVNPARPIPPASSRISGITDEMVADAPTMAEVYDRIEPLLGGSLLIAHNLNFDYLFLKREAELLGKDFSINVGIDTVSLARKALKGHRSYSLQNLANDLNLDVGKAHRALDDAVLCKNLFLECIAGIDGASDMTVKELFLYSNTRIKG